MKQQEVCPCSSGMNYNECCGTFHRGKAATTAVQLMRSRYSAYAKRLAEYIIKTTHPQNPRFERDAKKWKKEILKFCDSTSFNQLEILDSLEGDFFASVTFRAHLANGLEEYSYVEKSTFEKVNGAWNYLSCEFLD